MNEPTIYMVARAEHHERMQHASEGGEGYTITVQGWLPQQWSRLKSLVSQHTAQPETQRAASHPGHA